MSSPYTDLERPPLRAASLRRGLLLPGGFWSGLEVVDETGSTNADLARDAAAGGAEGSVLVAERQSAGQGRLGRSWQAPPRAGLTFSVLFRPTVPPERLGWLPLLSGVAAASALRRLTELDIRLKWPNDLLVMGCAGDGEPAERDYSGGRKLGGILAQRVPDAVVVGMGINVTLRRDELPAPHATSLALEGAATTDRDPLLRAVLRELAVWYRRWSDSAGDARASGLHAAYLAACATLGRSVRAMLPDGSTWSGRASDIDDDGRLLVSSGENDRYVDAGDIVHLR